ncbi:MAG: hypothetical protein Q9174_001579, partial [Haloplaca sp. 1 TL-2023]
GNDHNSVPDVSPSVNGFSPVYLRSSSSRVSALKQSVLARRTARTETYLKLDIFPVKDKNEVTHLFGYLKARVMWWLDTCVGWIEKDIGRKHQFFEIIKDELCDSECPKYFHVMKDQGLK